MVQRKFSSTVNVKAKCLLTFLITLRQRQHICVSTERVYEPVSAGQLAAPEALVAFSSQKKILVGQSSKQEGWDFSPIRSWGVFNTGSVKSCIKHWLWLHRQMAPVLPSTSSTFNKRWKQSPHSVLKSPYYYLAGSQPLTPPIVTPLAVLLSGSSHKQKEKFSESWTPTGWQPTQPGQKLHMHLHHRADSLTILQPP